MNTTTSGEWLSRPEIILNYFKSKNRLTDNEDHVYLYFLNAQKKKLLQIFTKFTQFACAWNTIYSKRKKVKHRYLHIFSYIHWKLHYMYADWQLCSQSHTDSLSNLTFYQIAIKRHYRQVWHHKKAFLTKLEFVFRSDGSGQDLFEFDYCWIYCTNVWHYFNISGTIFCIPINYRCSTP